jgi:cytochrome c oxidase subunit 2
MEPMMVFYAWLMIALLLILVYASFALSTRGAAGEEFAYQAIGRLRRPFFILMLVVLGVLFAFTVPRMPYPKGQTPDEVVVVTGKQFQFALSSQPIRTEEEFAQASANSPQIGVGRLVEFRVTSLDVNHGFGIYDPDGKLVGQTQAMPGYVNRLFLRFEKPGSYTILCLEYCGLTHHAMRGGFEVVERPTSTSRSNTLALGR